MTEDSAKLTTPTEFGDCTQGHLGVADDAPGGFLCPLHQDKEFSLAHVRTTFPELSSDARRPGHSGLRDNRCDRRTLPQARRHPPSVDRPYREAAAALGQQRGIRHVPGHAERNSRSIPMTEPFPLAQKPLPGRRTEIASHPIPMGGLSGVQVAVAALLTLCAAGNFDAIPKAGAAELIAKNSLTRDGLGKSSGRWKTRRSRK